MTYIYNCFYSYCNMLTFNFLAPIINTCADNGMFQCGDGTCISWDKVCNLQDDCGNGNDEGICGKYQLIL
jgi:hypothetical protein